MKVLAFFLLLCIPALASPYYLVNADTSYSTLGGVKTLTVTLRNNGNKQAACKVTVFNREKETSVAPYGVSKVSFDSLPDGAQPRFGCTAK